MAAAASGPPAAGAVGVVAEAAGALASKEGAFFPPGEAGPPPLPAEVAAAEAEVAEACGFLGGTSTSTGSLYSESTRGSATSLVSRSTRWTAGWRERALASSTTYLTWLFFFFPTRGKIGG